MKTIQFKLTAKVTIQIPLRKGGKKMKDEELYTYEAESGEKITFHAHPTRAWCYVGKQEQSNEKGLALMNQVVDAYLDKAINRGNNDYDEVIKMLEVKV